MIVRKIKNHIKRSDHIFAKKIIIIAKNYVYYSGPNLPKVYRIIRWFHYSSQYLFSELLRVFYFTPILKSHLTNPPNKLMLSNGIPLIQGDLKISIGENCRLSGMTSFSGRTVSPKNDLGIITPELIIGDNCGIGWQTGIAVGRRVIIGNNVRIAGRSTLAGYPGHPLDSKRRANGEPDDDNQVGDIILEDDVWLATGVNVMANVRIGRGTIVACGSIVTHDLPPNVLAAGIPAKVIRNLDSTDEEEH